MPTWTRSLVPLAVAAAVAATPSCSAQPAPGGAAGSVSTSTAPDTSRTAPLAPRPSATTFAETQDPANLARPAPHDAQLPVDPGSAATTDAPPRVSDDDVIPIVTWAGIDDDELVVNAYVPVLEQEGSCTLVLTRGADVVEVTTAAEPDAEVMWCAPLAIPLADLTSGAWEALTRYEGSVSTGTSAATTVSVP